MHTQNKLSNYKYQLFMLCCAVFWSTGGLLIKSVEYNAFIIAGCRSLIATIILLWFLKHNKQKFVINKFTIFMGIIICTKFILYVCANKLTTAANAIILQNTNPIFIVIFSAFVFKQHFTKKEISVVSLCAFGIVLFFIENISTKGLWGNIMALFSGALTAVMFLCSAKAKSSDLSMSGIICGHFLTAIIGLPFIFTTDIGFHKESVLCIITLGIFQMGIPYILYNKAMVGCSALNCSLIGMIEPILNPLWVFIFLKEKPSLFSLIGGTIVILTVTYWCVYSAKLLEKSQI